MDIVFIVTMLTLSMVREKLMTGFVGYKDDCWMPQWEVKDMYMYTGQRCIGRDVR